MSTEWPDRRSYESLAEELLCAAAEDDVWPGWAMSLAADRLGLLQDQRDLALGALANLVLSGLLVPGQNHLLRGFVAWDCEPREAVARIAAEWMAGWPSDYPPPAAIVTLVCSKAGKLRAAEIEARRDAPDR